MLQKLLHGVKKVGLKSKIVLSALALMTALLPFASAPIKADDVSAASNSYQPRFNFLQGDREMLQMSAPGMTDWADPVTAKNGDKVLFLVYFHNGVRETVAHNVKIRVDLPNDASTKLQMKSYLWSDETPYITDTIVDSKIVGNSGGTINLPSAARIRYVPGTTRIYEGGSQTGTALADGVTTSAGINIGDVKGCWQYSGYVTFQGELFGNSSLTLEKYVAPVGDGKWYEQINANPGETVHYQIAVRNDGDLIANSALVKDELATYTTYVPGTTYMYNKSTGKDSGIKMPDTLTTTGLNLTQLVPGNDGIIYLNFKAKIDNNIPAGTYGLVNVASVFIGTILQDRDEAKVIVKSTSNIDLDKTVYDSVTRNWEKISNGTLGDIKTFRVIVKNTGNTPLMNVKVRDVMPQFTKLTGKVQLNGNDMTTAQKDAFFSTGGLNIGTLNSNCSAEITFQVVVEGCPELGESLITNTAYSKADSVVEVISFAQIRINVIQPSIPSVR